jgi:cytochrome c553
VRVQVTATEDIMFPAYGAQTVHMPFGSVEAMAWMTSTLSQSEIASAAAYFAKNSRPARSARATSASPPALVAVYQACHQQNFVGGLPAPRLAGQSYEYLVEAMRRYVEGGRTNNAEMMNIMKALSPPEPDAMARYISAL